MKILKELRTLLVEMQITVKGTKTTNRGQLKFGNSFSNTKPELKAMMANCTKQKNEKVTWEIE